jgi:hypothetical protein
MMKALLRFIIIFSFFVTGVIAGEQKTPTSVVDKSKNDHKIVEVLEILELMEIIENLELFKEMDYLVEVKDHEKKD